MPVLCEMLNSSPNFVPRPPPKFGCFRYLLYRFKVQGFKFRGIVEVVYNEGHDLFDISFIKSNKVVATANDIFIDMLVDVIDTYVERTAVYEKRVKAQYSFSF